MQKRLRAGGELGPWRQQMVVNQYHKRHAPAPTQNTPAQPAPAQQSKCKPEQAKGSSKQYPAPPPLMTPNTQLYA